MYSYGDGDGDAMIYANLICRDKGRVEESTCNVGLEAP